MRYARAVWPVALYTPEPRLINESGPDLGNGTVHPARHSHRAPGAKATMNWQRLLKTVAANDAALAGRVREAAEGGLLKIEARKPGKGQPAAGPRILARWAVEWSGAL